MNKLLTLTLVILTFGLAGCSESTEPTEGKHYEPLPVNLSTFRVEPVIEVFSLHCSHCRKMEEALPELEQLVGQSFGKVHVTFNESAQVGAMIYYSAQMQLGHTPDHAMMTELFAAAQMGDGASLDDKKQAIDAAFETRNLTSPYNLDNDQQSQLFKKIERAHEMTTQGQINAVPMFIVKGKYRILTSAHSDIADIANTIQFLLAQP